jgi:nitrite reductase/ring-hydroxylating ferredoxin subunit
MDRKDFIKNCGWACVGVLGSSLMLSSCKSTQTISAIRENNYLLVAREKLQKQATKTTLYQLENSQLSHPLLIVESGETYTILEMRCTHQNNGLELFGDRLQCAAHGSEFNIQGAVLKGPAEMQLKEYNWQLDERHLKINIES